MKTLWRQLLVYSLLLSSAPAFGASEETVERNSLGAKLLQKGKTDAAIAEFQSALNTDPNYFPARLNLAYGYERAGKIEEAIAAYRAAIELQPRNFFARNNLGVLLDKKGSYDEAIAEFEHAIRSEPGNSMALKNRETAKKNQAAIQEREAQIAQAEKETRAKPNDPRAAYNLARIYAFYDQKEPALEWLTKAIKQGYKDFAYLNVDPAFKTIREDPIFIRLGKKQ